MTFSKSEGNSTVVGWISLAFFRVFRYWCNVTELEDCRDMVSGDYGIEEIGEEVACQRARVNDVLTRESSRLVPRPFENGNEASRLFINLGFQKLRA